jgi:hypothetical protein
LTFIFLWAKQLIPDKPISNSNTYLIFIISLLKKMMKLIIVF